MYVITSTDTERPLAIQTVLEDIPGGGSVVAADFLSTTLEMKEGAVLGKDSAGKYHLVKTAKIHENAGNTATDYKVKKGHEFKVGDVIMNGAATTKAYAITEIDTTTSEDYDTITVGTSLGVAVVAGEVLVQATAEAATAATGTYKYEPAGIALNTVDLTNSNTGCGILVRGTVVESLLAYFVDAGVKAKLPLVRFV